MNQYNSYTNFLKIVMNLLEPDSDFVYRLRWSRKMHMYSLSWGYLRVMATQAHGLIYIVAQEGQFSSGKMGYFCGPTVAPLLVFANT